MCGYRRQVTNMNRISESKKHVSPLPKLNNKPKGKSFAGGPIKLIRVASDVNEE